VDDALVAAGSLWPIDQEIICWYARILCLDSFIEYSSLMDFGP
jgi:hypothetical protein